MTPDDGREARRLHVTFGYHIKSDELLELTYFAPAITERNIAMASPEPLQDRSNTPCGEDPQDVRVHRMSLIVLY